MKRRDFLHTALAACTLAGCRASDPAAGTVTAAPTRGGLHEPIIDVHMHAYPADEVFALPLDNPITAKPLMVKNGEAHMQACLAEMKRLNIVQGVVSGGSGDRLGAALHWREAAPDRLIAGAGIRGSADTPL